MKLKKFFKAIESQDKDRVEKIIESEKSGILSLVDVDGWNAVHYCARFGNKVLMKVLLDAGGDVDGLTNYLYSPAVIAAKYNNIGCLHELVKHGANIDQVSKGGDSVIAELADHYAEVGKIYALDSDGILLNASDSEDELDVIGFQDYTVPIAVI